ncbi:transposase [Pseudofrankia sp. DC12]|uniref:transposase n=1 Tax=Pseudofrankia sp. DC12 TaxID=683315 RepID=UPI000A03BBD5|nr:transposase [Pseudofrankia sp. DC12]
MSPSIRHPPSFRAAAVARVLRIRASHTSESAAVRAVAAGLGINAETLRGWVRQAEIDSGRREGVTTSARQEIFRLRVELANARRALEKATGATTQLAAAQPQTATPPAAAPDRPHVTTVTVDPFSTGRGRPPRRSDGPLRQDGTQGADGAYS